jgi:hypothetical protein
VSQPAQIYVYQFAWQTPVLDGEPMAFHWVELPIVLDNPDVHERIAGDKVAVFSRARLVRHGPTLPVQIIPISPVCCDGSDLTQKQKRQ